jgi:outer membrane protein assembly factor BamB
MRRNLEGANWRPVKTAMTTATAICLVLAALANTARSESRLIRQEDAQRLGLTRAWFTQVRLDRARNHVERAVLEGNQLTVLTSAGVMQEINALTGETLWTAPIGNESYPSLGPTCSEQYVALVNGSTLYVLDRSDGRPVIIRRVGGAPGAAPALAAKYVFVPLVNGRIEGYPLEEKKKQTPWYYQSHGRSMVAPLATPESIVWTTDSGYLYVGNSEDPRVRFRLETGSEIIAPPSYLRPFVYVASTSGELFAMNELTGARRWKYATGFPVTRAAAPVGGRVFVTSEEPALHCVDATNGNMFWEAPHVSQFAAASKDRVYGIDDLGALVVLDGAKGTLVDRLATDHMLNTLVNEQTDRVYLVSDDGVIECLHERDAKVPLYHNPNPVEEKKPAAGEAQPPPTAAPAEKRQPKAKPSEEAAPPKDEAKQAEAPADKEKPEKPAGNFGVDDNPFGN